MAKNAYIGVGGVARKIKKIYVGVNGVARKVKKGFIGINGVARQWFSDGKAGNLWVGRFNHYSNADGTVAELEKDTFAKLRDFSFPGDYSGYTQWVVSTPTVLFRMNQHIQATYGDAGSWGFRHDLDTIAVLTQWTQAWLYNSTSVSPAFHLACGKDSVFDTPPLADGVCLPTLRNILTGAQISIKSINFGSTGYYSAMWGTLKDKNYGFIAKNRNGVLIQLRLYDLSNGALININVTLSEANGTKVPATDRGTSPNNVCTYKNNMYALNTSATIINKYTLDGVYVSAVSSNVLASGGVPGSMTITQDE